MIAKVGPRGQVVIPNKFRKELGLKEGHGLHITLVDGKLVMEPVKETIFDLVGSIEVEGDKEKLIRLAGELGLPDYQRWIEAFGPVVVLAGLKEYDGATLPFSKLGGSIATIRRD